MTLKELVQQSDNIVFFGGAGVSTESGIPDFRSETGIYNTIKRYKRSPEEILSHSFFVAHPDIFYDFYKSTMLYLDAKPNAAHLALARLEEMGKLKAVVTQNIDGLHQLAGSKRVYEVHGTVHRNYCMRCHEFYDTEYILKADGIPRCEKCGGMIKPDVVLYEEGLDEATIEGAVSAIRRADMLIVGGTSLAVYPAAGLIRYFRGDDLVVINKQPTPADGMATLLVNKPIGQALSETEGQFVAERKLS